MKELFLAELRRFRTAALLFALAHLLLQLVVNSIENLLEVRYEVHMVALAGFMACGVAFGLYQFGTWRQMGRWIWLLHRPLPRMRVFAAVAGASALLIVFAVGLPALAALLATKWFTARVVDLRHFTLVAHLVFLTLIAWLAGAHIILNRSRAGAAVLVLPFVMLAHLASGFVMLPPAIACTGLMACLAYGSFKPDRLAPPRGLSMTGLMALPLQLGFYLALSVGMTVMYQVAQMAAGVHPLSNPAPAGYFDLMEKSGNAAMRDGLAVSRDPRAAQWRDELGARKVGSILPMGRHFPVRDQASNREVIAWPDAERRILWTFSHDAMRFHGRDMLTGADRGWFGLHGFGDSTRFASVPVLPRPVWIMTSQHFYQVDFATQTTRELLALSGGEVLATPQSPPAGAPPGAHLYTLTNQRLIAHPARDSSAGELVNEFSAALPAPLSDLRRIDIAELRDGTLLSFNYGRKLMDGAPNSAQIVMFVDTQGHAQVIAQRTLAHDFGLLFEHREFWLSPVLQAVTALPELVLDKGLVRDAGDARHLGNLAYPRPPSIIAVAALCMLLSACGAWLWLRATTLPPRGKALWIITCLLLGLPALLSLIALQPRAVSETRQPSASPVAAARPR